MSLARRAGGDPATRTACASRPERTPNRHAFGTLGTERRRATTTSGAIPGARGAKSTPVRRAARHRRADHASHVHIMRPPTWAEPMCGTRCRHVAPKHGDAMRRDSRRAGRVEARAWHLRGCGRVHPSRPARHIELPGRVLKPTITPWSRWPEGHAGGKLPVTVGPLPKGYSCRSYGSLHKSARTPSNRRFTHNRRNAVDGEKDRAQPRATLAVHEHHVSAPLVSTSAPA